MAPSTRHTATATRAARKLPTFHNYAKVTKIQSVKQSQCVSSKNLEALSDIINAEKPRPAASQLKRKRVDEDDKEDFNKFHNARGENAQLSKDSSFIHDAISTQGLPPTPPASTPTSPTTISRPVKRACRKSPIAIPDGLAELSSMFACFLRAFSIHIAHNGPSAPADLDALISTVTQLYKLRIVTREDVQRMLAIYEIPSTSVLANRTLLLHRDSPFKLVLAGIGIRARYLVEHAVDRMFSEKLLLAEYAHTVETACSNGQRRETSFIHGATENYPLLAYQKGAQTQIKQDRIANVRNHILGDAPQRLRQQKQYETPEPDFTCLSIDDKEEPAQAPTSTKARTLSLFDRVRAKQSAASLVHAPAPAELIRRHAISRIGDIVEILRMKQNQRINPTATMSGNRVSFSMQQAMRLIKESLSVPIADEEVRVCIGILAREVDGGWLRVVEVGSMHSVILQGVGPRGEDVKKMVCGKC